MKSIILKIFTIIITMACFTSGISLSAQELERILCFGDSITEGTHINGKWTRDQSYVHFLNERGGGRYVFINGGRSNRRTSDYKELLPIMKQNPKIDRLWIYLGVNDVAQNEKHIYQKETLANMQTMIKSAREFYGERLKIGIISSPMLATGRVSQKFHDLGFNKVAQEQLEKLRNEYKKMAQELNCDFYDLAGVVSHKNYSDGLHPNLAGQKQTADYLFAKLVNNGGKIKLACVGDSITFGYTLPNRKHNNYPAQLQRMLGTENYEVENFGVSSRTLLNKGNHPYNKEKAYQNSLKFTPNIVVIKLGSNDSKPINWKHKDDFVADLKNLVASYQALPTMPKVILATPAYAFGNGKTDISQETIKNEIIPLVDKVAKELKLEVIDCNTILDKREFYCKDGIHPNIEGATLIAQTVYEKTQDRPFHAGIHLPAIFTDGMILQRYQALHIWGRYKPNRKVTVEIADVKVETKSDETGYFFAKLPAIEKTGGPYELKFTTENGTAKLKDILFGDVWLCSGQSNMEFLLKGNRREPVNNSLEEIKNANYPLIKSFKVATKLSLHEEQDTMGEWIECTPKTAGDFSAVAYFFAREIHTKMNKVPIGLIVCSLGGTPCEAWSSYANLAQIPGAAAASARVKNLGSASMRQLKEEMKDEQANLYEKLLKLSENNWTLATAKLEGWQQFDVPKKWSQNNYTKSFAGVIAYHKVVTLPDNWQGKELIVELGKIDDQDITFFNGVKIGNHNKWDIDRKYKIPASAVKSGKNILAVAVINNGGEGGFHSKKEQMKISLAENPSESINVSQNWLVNKIIAKNKITAELNPLLPPNKRSPNVLYNGMISPIIPMSIKGAIWYQGESNTVDPPLYKELFPAMVKEWRRVFKQGNFPFYYVQIAPYGYAQAEVGSKIRDVQRQCLALIPESGMASVQEIDGLKGIHPPHKKEVGERLAKCALSMTYGFDAIVPSGPIYTHHKIIGETIKIHFNYLGGGLVAPNGVSQKFEIAGEDGKFVKATAIVNQFDVVVSSPQVKNPKYVRYCWHNRDLGDITNKHGLPMSTFTTKPW